MFQMFGKRDELSWITCEKSRQVIACARREAEICLREGAYTAAQVMFGSVIEGALSYGLMRIREEVPDNMALEKLIALARERGLLAQGQAFLSQSIRDYRNLVHPRRQILENREVTRETVELTRNACQDVLRELEHRLNGYIPVSVNAYLTAEGNDVTIARTPFTLGRDPASSRVFASKNVSTCHARITFHAGSFFIEDCKSRNGTFLSDQSGKEKKLKPHKPAALSSPAHIRLGTQGPVLVFCIKGAELLTEPEK